MLNLPFIALLDAIIFKRVSSTLPILNLRNDRLACTIWDQRYIYEKRFPPTVCLIGIIVNYHRTSLFSLPGGTKTVHKVRSIPAVSLNVRIKM